MAPHRRTYRVVLRTEKIPEHSALTPATLGCCRFATDCWALRYGGLYPRRSPEEVGAQVVFGALLMVICASVITWVASVVG